MSAVPIAPIIELLLVICLVVLAVRWIKLPYTIALVLAGLALALTKLIPPISLTHDIAFYVILPPILFYGAMHLDLGHLKKDWGLISLLAIPGVIACALLIAYPLSYFWNIPLSYALLFGALISATDPVSVLAILKKIKAPDRLRTILEAESLLNDGTGVVLFMVILGMVQSAQPLNLPHACLQFILVTGGGALIGGLCSLGLIKIIELTDNPLLELILTIALAFGSMLIAQVYNCSGIIAVVVAGLMMGQARLSCMSKKGREINEIFWSRMDLIMNTLIFLIIGLQLQVVGVNVLFESKKFVLIGIALVLASRILIIYPTVSICNQFIKPTIPSDWDHILFWGGLRGTIPIILALQLPESPYRPLFLTATFGIVLFNLLVQGLTIEPLLRRLNLRKEN